MKPEMRLNEPPETYHATRAISKSGMDKLRVRVQGSGKQNRKGMLPFPLL